METSTETIERRGAVKGLRAFLVVVNAERADLRGERASEAHLLADALEDFAARVERGAISI